MNTTMNNMMSFGGFNVAQENAMNNIPDDHHGHYVQDIYGNFIPTPNPDPNMGYPMTPAIVSGTFSEFRDDNDTISDNYVDEETDNAITNLKSSFIREIQMPPAINNGIGYTQPQNTFSPFAGTVYGNPQPSQLGGLSYSNMPNTPLYNSLYGNYYNPYLAEAQKRQEEAARRAAEREAMMLSSIMFKTISKGLNSISDNPIENIEEHIRQYDVMTYDEYMARNFPPEPSKLRVSIANDNGEVIYDPAKKGYYAMEERQVKFYGIKRLENMERDNTLHLIDVHFNAIPYNLELAMITEARNRLYDAHKKEFPDTMGLAEYLSKAGILLVDAMVYEDRQRKLEELKNRNARYANYNFQNKGQTGISYFDTRKPAFQGDFKILRNVDGNLEITVPDRLQDSERDRRAQEFFERIRVKR